ncbi:structure-specific endonuclease subunit SLX1 like protein [Ditylenchus destructor]|uniref:Structure-specific endonuclease subunit SLX1 like protein n=1 Tax=Ditylenchus destructor TaxID=166010 RepID=A0AAD4MSW3_9BILA|nr:structure-specific endonuclease subunit SLX1 like protein [Ditylenchus destructor]
MEEEPQDDGLELECGDLDGERGELEGTIVLDDTLEEKILEKSDRISRSYGQVSFDPINGAINSGYDDAFGFSPPRMSWNAGLDEPFVSEYHLYNELSSTPNNPTSAIHDLFPSASVVKQQSPEAVNSASLKRKTSVVKQQSPEAVNSASLKRKTFQTVVVHGTCEAELKKSRNESPFAFRLRIACQMLNSDPWNRLALTFRWLLPECEIPFPTPLPKHIGVAYGKVQKVNTLVPDEINEYATLNNCYLCERKIPQIKRFVRCLDFDNCCTHFHARCLAEHVLKEQHQLNELLVPLSGKCPKCVYSFLWGDLIRDQRMLNEIDEAKPRQDGVKVADGMIPIKITKK